MNVGANNENDAIAVAKAPPRNQAAPAAPHAAAIARPSALTQLSHGARAVIPYANYAAQRLGRIGVVGVALWVFSLIVLVSANSPLRQQLASDTTALEQLSTPADGAAAAATAATPQAQFETFLNQLPSRDDLPSLMAQVVAASASTGVELEEGKYELVAAGKAGHIARYRMSFPVMGSYPQVRAFVDKALVAVPAMSLDGLRLQRREIGEGIVTARLDFAVFVQTGS